MNERIRDVDALRGFALLGILVVNLNAFASPYYGSEVHDPAFASSLDQAVGFGVSMLFELKFYLLFSFLFGYSFTLQMASAERDGHPLRPRILRRQLGLFLIGCAHGALLFHGDILTIYAALGLILLAARATTDRRALTAAVIVLGASALVWAVLAILVALDGKPIDAGAAHAHAARATVAYRGTVSSVLAQRAHDWPITMTILTVIQGPNALAMFLLGLVAGRRGLLADPASHRTLLDRMWRIGLPVGLIGAAVYAWTAVFGTTQAHTMAGLAINVLTAPALAAAYLALVIKLLAARPAIAAALAPAGRTAASNYLLQSLLCSLIFTAYGLALIGHVAPAHRLLIAAAIFSAQLGLSAWWLRHRRYGPVEWLLRRLTRW